MNKLGAEEGVYMEMGRKAIDDYIARTAKQLQRGVLSVKNGKWWVDDERELRLSDVAVLVVIGRIELVCVFAGEYRQMVYYMKQLHINPQKVIYLTKYSLQGLDKPTVIVCGTAYRRDDYDEVMEWLKSRDAVIYRM